MFELTWAEIDTGRLSRQLSSPQAGALCVFEGRVRNNHLGRAVLALEYEAAPSLAFNEFQNIVQPILKEKIVIDIWCVHRVGRLDVGETAIWLGVLAGHRAEAFLTCEHLMSEIKKRLPIWKKEFFADGSSSWVDDACGCM